MTRFSQCSIQFQPDQSFLDFSAGDFLSIRVPSRLQSSCLDMPWYNIDHVIPLTREQCNKLAQRITDLHAQTFTTPKFFVNVRYRDASDDWAYIAGKQVRG